MNRIFTLLFILLLCVSLTGCGQQGVANTQHNDNNAQEMEDDTTGQGNEKTTEEFHIPVTIKESDDVHIAYIKDYVGKNCAMVGYTSWGGDRNDYLGNGYLTLILVTADGTYVDIEDEEVLKEYVVVAQALEPNTEVTFEFDTDSDGKEYSFPSWQSVGEMVLHVRKVKEGNSFSSSPTAIKVSTDRHIGYIPDLVGRNLNATGYTSMGGDRRIEIGDMNFKLNIVSPDGSFIDVEDYETLKNYVVVAQSLEPNTELRFEYAKDGDGNEYNWVEHSNYNEMDIYVKSIGE